MRIYTTAEWGARAPKGPIERVGAPVRIIEHHTAGHVPNIDPGGETLREAKAYARAIQSYHMDGNGWLDSGHNFLVTRGGFVLEGRHGSVAAIEAGRMVRSAHCPGQNGNPGIEHEHQGLEPLPEPLRSASVDLNVWIIRCCPTIPPHELQPHGDYVSTDCPSPVVRAWLPELRAAVTTRLQMPIRGVSFATLKQMIAWARAHGCSAEHAEIARLYARNGPNRGRVRADVAWAQACYETNFFRFGGVIDATYHNPCGLKTRTGGSNTDPAAHQRFPSWEVGTTAHMDHLALYAGAPGYPRAGTPDPRHFAAILGTAPTVQMLGGRWAPSPTYGDRVAQYVKDIRAVIA